LEIEVDLPIRKEIPRLALQNHKGGSARAGAILIEYRVAFIASY